MKLKLWREPDNNKIVLDTTPTGREEEEFLFSEPVDDPRDLNDVVLRERIQNMSERILYADRAFLVTMIWVVFLVVLSVVQIIVSAWKFGLSDAQFVTVVTTTTASVFGFWLLVGKYLHHQPSDHSEKQSRASSTDASDSAQSEGDAKP